MYFSTLSTAQNDLNEAWELLNSQSYNEAVQYLEKFILQSPENPEAHYFLGQAYYKLHCPDGSYIDSTDINLALNASMHFNRSVQISPEYSGRIFIMDPYSKLTAIWGTMAMSYICRGKPDSALWAFKFGQNEGGFRPALLEYNRNVLATCEEGAILFTNGDNDTFPMWFLQMVEGYRKDVTIINTSLLNISWYIRQIKSSYPFGSNNAIFNLSEAEIDSLTPIHWQDTEFELPEKGITTRNRKMIWIVKPTIENIGIRTQDQVMLEILKANIEDRPIYFSSTLSKENRLGLDYYLRCDGLAYCLSFDKSEKFPEVLSNNIFKVYSFKELEDEYTKYSKDIISLIQNYRFSLAILSWFWYENEDKDKAKEILEKMFEMFPEESFSYVNPEVKKSFNDYYNLLSN